MEWSAVILARYHSMQIDFEVQRFSRRCASTLRQLEPGEVFFSVLQPRGADVVRTDYSAEAWQGPPEDALGWWQSRVPEPSAKKAKLAPNDVLLELFDQLADQLEWQDMRYVLALLLIRRRVLRMDDGVRECIGQKDSTIVVHCPRRDETYFVAEVVPDEDRIEAIEQQLADLLYAGAQ